MRTGKLNISRGFQLPEQRPEEPKLSLVETTQEPTAAPPQAELPADHRTIADRLEILERLARLRSLDLLSAEEFAAEKAFILAHQGPEQAWAATSDPAHAARAKSVAGPTLAGKLFSWKFVPIGLVAGLALSFGAQPQETMRFFDQALSLVGA